MSFLWRVCIPSKEGVYERILSSDQLLTNHMRQVHGPNFEGTMLLVVSWTGLIADSPFDAFKPNRVINKFLNRLVHDLFGTIASLSSLADLLCESQRRSEDGSIIAPFLVEFKDTPIFREYLEFTKTRDPLLFKFILSFLVFGKKLYYKDDNLNAIAFREWLEIEDRLRTDTMPEWICNLKDVMSFIFQSYPGMDVFLPKHGSGAVSEQGVRGIINKNLNFSMPEKIYYTYVREHNMIDPLQEMGTPLPDGSLLSPCVRLDHSRLKFVPKDYKKTRSICMEPIPYMWAQQAVRLSLERFLSDGLLGAHVFLHDQTHNQRASAFGSKTQKLDTLDLSSASDSVSWELVKNIFPASIYKHLLATRTSTVKTPDGKIRSMSKFAPMGSALCFPTQCAVYSSIIIMVSIAKTYGLDWKKPGCFTGIDLAKGYDHTFSNTITSKDSRFLPFYAYGDDLILDNRITSSVVECLTSLNFKVNLSKSFTGSQIFRESCGGFYLDGSDVTPIRFKIKEVNRRISIESMASIIELANRAFEYGYTFLRKHLIQFALHYPIQGVNVGRGKMNPILFSSDPDSSFSILCDTPRNTHLRRRVFDISFTRNVDALFQEPSFDKAKLNLSISRNVPDYILLQRDEFRSISPGPLKRRKLSKKFDNYRYVLWWRSQYHESEDEALSSSSCDTDTLGVGAKWRWTAT